MVRLLTGNELVAHIYETPFPQDWVGFATQMHHQASGGPSYLFGARRMQGWWYYYLVAVAVKVPLTFWILAVDRLIRTGVRSFHSPTTIFAAAGFSSLHGHHGCRIISQL